MSDTDTTSASEFERRSVALLPDTQPAAVAGRIHACVGLGLTAHLPGARRGDWVVVERRDGGPLDAEVVGFRGEEVTLMPFGDARGVGPGDPVRSVGRPLSIACSDALLGRVLDGLGRPLDDDPAIHTPLDGSPDAIDWPVRRPAPRALQRRPVREVLATGVRAIDATTSLAHGQRIGLFAGSGVGKSSLLNQLARQADAEVCVIALIGERGRELRDLVHSLPAEVRARSVIVCATSDTPALVRMESAHVATAIAEYFRSQGRRVLLLADSLTRFARAAREVALAAGEPASRRGYPASAFAELPGLIERAGCDAHGSITAIYTVLVEGENMDDPVADELRGLLDGHLVLRRELAERGRFPAIDVASSLSRLMHTAIEDDTHRDAANKLRTWLARYESKRDLVELGAYEAGADPVLDQVLARLPAIETFLRQQQDECSDFDETVAALKRLVS